MGCQNCVDEPERQIEIRGAVRMGGSKSMSSYCYFGIRNIFKQSGVLKIILGSDLPTA